MREVGPGTSLIGKGESVILKGGKGDKCDRVVEPAVVLNFKIS